MKLRKILAALVSCAVVAGYAAIPVSANVVSYTGERSPHITVSKDRVQLKLIDERGEGLLKDLGWDPSAVYGFRVEVTAGKGEWFGGALIFNFQSNNWDRQDFNCSGNDPIKINKEGDSTLTRLSSNPIGRAKETYANLIIQVWDTSGIVIVRSIVALDKDGNPLAENPNKAVEAEEPAAEDAAPASDAHDCDDDCDEHGAAPVPADVAPVVVPELEGTPIQAISADIPEAEDFIWDDDDFDEEPADLWVGGEVTGDAAVEPVAPEVITVTNPPTGNTAVAAIVSVLALAGAAVVVSRKRK